MRKLNGVQIIVVLNYYPVVDEEGVRHQGILENEKKTKTDEEINGLKKVQFKKGFNGINADGDRYSN